MDTSPFDPICEIWYIEEVFAANAAVLNANVLDEGRAFVLARRLATSKDRIDRLVHKGVKLNDTIAAKIHLFHAWIQLNITEEWRDLCTGYAQWLDTHNTPDPLGDEARVTRAKVATSTTKRKAEETEKEDSKRKRRAIESETAEPTSKAEKTASARMPVDESVRGKKSEGAITKKITKKKVGGKDEGAEPRSAMAQRPAARHNANKTTGEDSDTESETAVSGTKAGACKQVAVPSRSQGPPGSKATRTRGERGVVHSGADRASSPAAEKSEVDNGEDDEDVESEVGDGENVRGVVNATKESEEIYEGQRTDPKPALENYVRYWLKNRSPDDKVVFEERCYFCRTSGIFKCVGPATGLVCHWCKKGKRKCSLAGPGGQKVKKGKATASAPAARVESVDSEDGDRLDEGRAAVDVKDEGRETEADEPENAADEGLSFSAQPFRRSNFVHASASTHHTSAPRTFWSPIRSSQRQGLRVGRPPMPTRYTSERRLGSAKYQLSMVMSEIQELENKMNVHYAMLVGLNDLAATLEERVNEEDEVSGSR